MHTSLTQIVSRTAVAAVVVSFCAGLAYGQSLEHTSDAPGKNIIHIYPGTGVGPSGPTSTGGTVTTFNNPVQTSIVPPPLTYHGGPVMRNPINYLIFWQPKSSPQYAVPFPAPAAYQTGIETFFQRIGGTPLYNIITQYTDGGGAPPNSASWGGSWVDTSTAAPSGCNGTATGAVGATPNCPLTDADIQNEVEVAIKANPSWAVSNVNVEYFVYTPSNVGQCSGLDNDKPTPDQSCWTISGGVGPGEGGDYCAYHSYSSNNRIYAYMPFASNGSCYPFFGTSFPNGATLDVVISPTSHEMIESNTDPHIDGWLDSTGAEIGDKCAYQYGFVAPDGTDLLLKGNRYLIQTEWSNQVSGCAKRLSPFTDSLNIPQPLSFGDVQAGGSSSMNLSIANSGAAGSGNATNIIYTRLSASSDFAFSLPGVPPTWDTLNSGGTFPVSVLFAPFLPSRSATGAVIIDTDETPCDSTLLPKSGNSCNVSLSEIVNPLSAAVVTGPSISKAFGAASIALGTSTSLSFTITNPNTVGITGVGFTDSLPAGLTAGGVSGSCGGGTISIGPPISLTGASLAAGASCTFSVVITGATPGAKNNVTSNVTSAEGGSGNQATAALLVVAPPVISKAFSPTSIPLSSTTTLTFIITNPSVNTVALDGVAFSDTLPSGLTVVTGSSPVCGGTGTLTMTFPASIGFSGATIAASGTCTINVTVTGAAAGNYTNTTGNVSSTNGGAGNSASAHLTVVAPPSISKGFFPSSISLSTTSALTFTITNPTVNTVALTDVAFGDALPSGLTVASFSSPVCGGMLTTTSPTSIVLSGATIGPGNTCVFTVTVTGAVAGIFPNNTGNVSSTNGGTGNTAAATLTVLNPGSPHISKAFSPPTIAAGGTAAVILTLSNGNATDLTGAAFSDTLVNMSAAGGPVGGTCVGTTPSSLSAGATALSFTGITIPAVSSCTLTFSVTSGTIGANPNTTSGVSTVQFPAAGAASNTATLTVVNVVMGPPFQVSYVSNLPAGDSFINISNAGASGAGLQYGTTASVTGAICANIYAFTPDEQMVSCCSCPVTPNGLVSLSAKNDLASNTLTPAIPTTLVVKLLATAPVGGSCTNSAAAVETATQVLGLVAFRSTIHATPLSSVYGVTEVPFSGATLSTGSTSTNVGELARLGQLCNFLIANGNSYGACSSCRLGGLGADRQ